MELLSLGRSRSDWGGQKAWRSWSRTNPATFGWHLNTLHLSPLTVWGGCGLPALHPAFLAPPHRSTLLPPQWPANNFFLLHTTSQYNLSLLDTIYRFNLHILQYTTVHYSILQYITVYYSILQYTTVYYCTLYLSKWFCIWDSEGVQGIYWTHIISWNLTNSLHYRPQTNLNVVIIT